MEPPLTQPLDNIEAIKQSLSHGWQPFESAPDGVELLWYFYDSKTQDVFTKMAVTEDSHVAVWQPLPPPPEIKNV